MKKCGKAEWRKTPTSLPMPSSDAGRDVRRAMFERGEQAQTKNSLNFAFDLVGCVFWLLSACAARGGKKRKTGELAKPNKSKRNTPVYNCPATKNQSEIYTIL